MKTYKFALVEDNAVDINSFQEAVKEINDLSDVRSIEYEIFKTAEEAMQGIDESFDGVILDIRLDEDGNGFDVIKNLVEQNKRIPITIFTATPGEAPNDVHFFKEHKKSEVGVQSMFEEFIDFHNTGISNIIGYKGIIENYITESYLNNILPNIDSWIGYGKDDPSKTEAALIRHVFNHLMDKISLEIPDCFAEEFYIYPPYDDNLHTGSVITEKDNTNRYLVISPLCDLAKHDGIYKTDTVQIIKIETYSDIVDKMARKKYADKHPEILEPQHNLSDSETISIKKIKKDIETKIKNNRYEFLHFMPSVEHHNGGVINFRKISFLDIDKFCGKYNNPLLKIAPQFLKTIVSRFSSYYARQGQPEFIIK